MMEETKWEHLPYEGGLLDQPARLWERLQICRELVEKWEKVIKPQERPREVQHEPINLQAE